MNIFIAICLFVVGGVKMWKTGMSEGGLDVALGTVFLQLDLIERRIK